MKRTVLLLALLTLGCAGGKHFVADQTAAHHYHKDRYDRVCREVVGPPACKEFQNAINLQLRLTRLANEVQERGRLPKEEKRELRELMDKIRRLP